VHRQLVEILEQAQREVTASEHSHVAEVLAERDHDIIHQLRTRRVKKQTIDDLEAFLAQERQDRLEAAKVERVVGLDAEETSHLRSLLDHDLDRIADQTNNAGDERHSLVDQLEDVVHTLAAVPDNRALDALQTQREQALTEWTTASAAAAQADAQVKEAETKLADAQCSVERLLQKATDEVTENDDIQRIIQHSERVRQTLATLRAEATRRNLHRIQALVIEALQRLLHKDQLVTELQIDPATFTIELRGRDGTVILPQQLSAGERQLLAVSLLWGLAQASGRPLPVVIDTPLGRLDGVHRGHLISRYFPHASHQVILLSTDQEIDHEAWTALYPHVGHAYRLEYNDDKGHTTAEAGYFWPAPTT
jgi:DNA sulfur modification protein DndD